MTLALAVLYTALLVLVWASCVAAGRADREAGQ